MGEEEFSFSQTTSKTGHYISMKTTATGRPENKKQHEDCQLVEEGRCWSDLLPEIMDLVAAHCSISDLAMLRATCKSWQTVGKRIHRSRSNWIGSSRSWFSSPVLITTEDERCTFYSPLSDLIHSKVIPELVDKMIIGSMYGWLVLILQVDPNSVFLFNVTTSVRIELPRSSHPHYFQHAWLSSPPNSLDCYIICMEDTMWDFGILRRGEENWTYCNCRRGFTLACPPAMCQGKLYFLDKKGRLSVFDLTDFHQGIGEFAFDLPQHLKQWKRRGYSFEQSFLVESQGELLATFLSDHHKNKVSVFSLNPSDGTWRTVRSLGDNLLFLSYRSSFVEKGTEKGTANKVYLPKFTAEGDYTVYDFATGAYRTLLADVRDPNSEGRSRFVKEVKLSSAWYQSAYSATCTKAFNW